jgi:hypothetical protein
MREIRVTPLPGVMRWDQAEQELVLDDYSAGAVWAAMESGTVS